MVTNSFGLFDEIPPIGGIIPKISQDVLVVAQALIIPFARGWIVSKLLLKLGGHILVNPVIVVIRQQLVKLVTVPVNHQVHMLPTVFDMLYCNVLLAVIS